MKELRQDILTDVSKVMKSIGDILLNHNDSSTENSSGSLPWSSLDVCPSRSHHASSIRHTEAWTVHKAVRCFLSAQLHLPDSCSKS